VILDSGLSRARTHVLAKRHTGLAALALTSIGANDPGLTPRAGKACRAPLPPRGARRQGRAGAAVALACWFFARVHHHAVRTGLIARYTAETVS
jgi:hypothetical protein